MASRLGKHYVYVYPNAAPPTLTTHTPLQLIYSENMVYGVYCHRVQADMIHLLAVQAGFYSDVVECWTCQGNMLLTFFHLLHLAPNVDACTMYSVGNVPSYYI